MKSPARLVVGAKDIGQSPGQAPSTSERGRRGGWVGGGMEGHFGSGPQLKKGSQSNEGPYNFLIQDCLTENINLGCVSVWGYGAPRGKSEGLSGLKEE